MISTVWNWLNGTNLGSIALGFIFWSGPVTAWLHYQHIRDRRHVTAHHERLLARIEELEGKTP